MLLCLTVASLATAAEEKRLYIYNWSDFIGPDTIAQFEKATGIKVTYDVYDAEETMEARLMAGSSGYDVVSASTDFFGREIKAGRVWVNCYHAYPAHAAFGGYKQSGIGRETHKMMLDHYQQTKNLLVSYSPKALGFF